MAKVRLQTWVLNCTSALKRTVSTPTSSVLRRPCMHSVCSILLHGIHRISCSCFKRLTGIRSVKQSRLINPIQFQLMENQPKCAKCVCTWAYLLLDAQAESWPETTSLWTGLDVVDVDHLGQASCHCEPDSEHNLNPGNFPRIDVWWVIRLHWNGEWPSSGSSKYYLLHLFAYRTRNSGWHCQSGCKLSLCQWLALIPQTFDTNPTKFYV